MDLVELDHRERLALVGLLRWLSMADGVLSVDERSVLGTLRADLGAAEWGSLSREAALSFKKREHLQTFCSEQVERPEARRLIYNTLVKLAGADWWDAEEVRILNWVGVAWGLVAAEAVEGADADFDLADPEDGDGDGDDG